MEQSLPGTGEPITSQSVQEAQRATEASNVALMNQMEESVPTNGEFFIKLGDAPSEGTTQIRDTRALILKEGRPMNFTGGEPTNPVDGEPKLTRDLRDIGISDVPHEDSRNIDVPEFLVRKPTATSPEHERQYMVVTAKGARIITLDPATVTNSPFHPPGRNNGLNYSDGGRSIIWGETRISTSEITTDADEQFLNEAMTKSIEASRKTSENAKNKAALDEAQKEQARAKRISGLLEKIQPPAGEGPAAPPPQSPTGRFGS